MSIIYLIPSPLEEESLDCIPAYVRHALDNCSVIFAENERTARRFLKKLDKDIHIDSFEWFTISKDHQDHEDQFIKKIREQKNIAIISEAGCPGIADPGQSLTAIAHRMQCEVRPLAGPISPMLALMASGMNGQHFEFMGYLPIDASARMKAIRELEAESAKKNSTKIFIETPYRNNQLLEAILNQCHGDTRLCIASNLTGPAQSIRTLTVREWKMKKPDLHKQPAVFLIHAGK